MAKLGETVIHRGQLYTAIELLEHERRDGETTMLLRWLSTCTQCGSPFSFTAPALASRFQPNRRCGKHKRPGISPRPRRDQQDGGARG